MDFKERKRLLFFGLPWTFTTYTVKEDMVTINTGLLSRTENDCFMYKIQDVTLVTSLFERLFRLGTITCNTADVTHPVLVFTHIKNAKAIKEFILKQSELERIKRKTLNTQNIGVYTDDMDNLSDLD